MSLIYENNVPIAYRNSFISKIKEIANKLAIDPNWLMAIMYFESARSFSPSIKNQIGSVGLIQFTRDKAGVEYKTINGKRYYLADLAKMSANQQLDVVYEYYKPFVGKIKNYLDTYLVTFFPAAIGKPLNYVFQTSNLPASMIAGQNPAFDTNKDKKIELWEVKKVMLERLPKEWLNIDNIPVAIKSFKMPIAITAGTIIITSLAYLGYGKYIKK